MGRVVKGAKGGAARAAVAVVREVAVESLAAEVPAEEGMVGHSGGVPTARC